jgi:hypothetical protein
MDGAEPERSAGVLETDRGEPKGVQAGPNNGSLKK